MRKYGQHVAQTRNSGVTRKLMLEILKISALLTLKLAENDTDKLCQVVLFQGKIGVRREYIRYLHQSNATAFNIFSAIV